MRGAIVSAAGRVLRDRAPLVPIRLRKTAAVLVHRLPGSLEDRVIPALLHDWAATEPGDYHRFIWANHLLYAKYYDFREIEHSRGRYFAQLHPLRAETLETAAAYIRAQWPDTNVDSVLDVGCSLGYLLRYAETTVFPGAQRLVGIDIDGYAVAEGARYLAENGSRIELTVADIDGLKAVTGGEPFDVVTCTGVLQYLDGPAAKVAVGRMLSHCRKLLALSGPAWEDADNRELGESVVRDYDRSMIHNFDRMVSENGGRVVARRWDGKEVVDGRRGAYFVIAAPG